MMKKRLKFECYDKECLHHKEPFTWLKDIDPKQNPILLVTCPNCQGEWEVRFGEHTSKVDKIFQASEGATLSLDSLDLDQTFRTKPRASTDDSESTEGN